MTRPRLRRAAGGDEVFRQLVLARIIEPTSKVDSVRVLEEAGVARGLVSARSSAACPVYADDELAPRAGRGVRGACGARAGQSLVLYDVTTLYFETDAADGFREPGFSKERRLEPQITIGLLTDAAGFPLMVEAFEGNKAETKTMLPIIDAFMAAHQLADVTVVADAGMVSEANRKAIEDAGLSFIIGARIPEVPYVVSSGAASTPAQAIPTTGRCSPQPWPATGANKAAGRRDKVIYYQYRADRARRTLRGIDEQIAKAEKAVAGKVAVKRNRFIKLTGGTKR